LIYGAIAFVISFIAVVAYFFYRLNEITDGNIGNILPEEPQVLAWPFYNANRIDIVFSAGGDPVNYIEFVEPMNPLVFNAIPVIFLVLAGYSVASRVQTSLAKEASAVAGASVAVGYVPLLALSTFAFEIQDSGVTAGPELGITLLFFGTLFAVVAGGIGGYVAG
jgi:hypothetical protein